MAILLQGAGKPNDHYFIDTHGHYSLWDAAQASNRPITVFPHCNFERLAELIKSELHSRGKADGAERWGFSDLG